MEVKKMPELPEVETVKENLKKRLINTKINDVKVLYNNIIAYPDTNTFEKTLKNKKVKEKELNNIIKSTKEVLNKAIAKGGTTIHTYTSVDGIKGTYQDSLFVHNKEKELCKVCQTQIKKIKVGGRGTYYCPHCQK